VYILYVDESGVEQLNVPPPHFVLLGLMIPASDWKSLDASIEAVKARYGLAGIEIHTAWMTRRYSEQEKISGFASLDRGARVAAFQKEVHRRSGVLGVRGNRKKIKAYRKECREISRYAHLTRDERRSCLRDLATELANWNGIKIFADAISKSDYQTGVRTPYEMAFEQVLTRYQAYLSRVEGSGIVVHDNNDTVAPRLSQLSRKFHEEGTFYLRIPSIVETPLFVDSSLTSMIQMADLCSYALRRTLEKNETDIWDIVEPLVDELHGKNVGVRHYTGPRPCNCRICIAHGRR
jgi:Protein of unknown function (DUF3800)